jgi:hypothetical protein
LTMPISSEPMVVKWLKAGMGAVTGGAVLMVRTHESVAGVLRGNLLRVGLI